MAKAIALEKRGITTVGDLARASVDEEKYVRAVSSCSRLDKARQVFWKLKRAAAVRLDVELGDEPPPIQKFTERTQAHQRALDVAARWASRAGTADDEVATEYATALAAIARRQLSKNSSGGDGVAKPPQKKQHC